MRLIIFFAFASLAAAATIKLSEDEPLKPDDVSLEPVDDGEALAAPVEFLFWKPKKPTKKPTKVTPTPAPNGKKPEFSLRCIACTTACRLIKKHPAQASKLTADVCKTIMNGKPTFTCTAAAKVFTNAIRVSGEHNACAMVKMCKRNGLMGIPIPGPVGDLMRGVLGKVGGLLEGVGGAVGGVGDLASGIANGVGGLVHGATDSVGGVLGGVPLVGGALKGALGAAGGLTDGLASAVGGVVQHKTGGIGGAIGSVGGLLNGNKNPLEAATGILGGLTSAAGGVLGGIGGLLGGKKKSGSLAEPSSDFIEEGVIGHPRSMNSDPTEDVVKNAMEMDEIVAALENVLVPGVSEVDLEFAVFAKNIHSTTRQLLEEN